RAKFVADDLAILRRQRVVHFLVDDQDADDVGQRQVDHVPDLRVPLERDRTRRRVRGSVDQPGLQARVDVGERQRNRRDTASLERRLGNAIALRNPDLGRLQIVLVFDVVDADQVGEAAAADPEYFKTIL